MEKAKILIVEDSDDAREMMADLLRYAGYRVEEARNGLEAYRLLSACDEQPNLVLLDLMMPVMSGPELVEALSDDPKLAELPIVIVSAAMESISTGSVKRALKKPVSFDLLLKVVDECCTREAPSSNP
ncbi:MAG TPA: response regulator [Polyangiaceae bacterium]|nr:response regulator [Polyangiaceae bacterium]